MDDSEIKIIGVILRNLLKNYLDFESLYFSQQAAKDQVESLFFATSCETLFGMNNILLFSKNKMKIFLKDVNRHGKSRNEKTGSK